MKAVASPRDPLFELERKIARRADEISRQLRDSGRSIEPWCQAEREIWDGELALAEMPSGELRRPPATSRR
jgi:hypothetical protein